MGKKVITGMVLSLLLICASTWAFSNQLSSEITEPIFEDDFESYAVGTFPYAGGWELWANGAGNEWQVIVDNVSMSPSKSLHLWGLDGWCAVASKRYVADSIRLGFEVYVRVKELGGIHGDIARVGFTERISPSNIRFFSAIMFLYNGKIALIGHGEIESYVPGKWYKVTQIIDKSKDTCSVWIDDVLKVSNASLATNDHPSVWPEKHYKDAEALSLSAFYAGTEAYFDDVKLFQYGPSAVQLSIKLSGEHDYPLKEDCRIRLTALVQDVATMKHVSDANVTIEIYDPDGILWISDTMVEKLTDTGVYEWESEETIRQLRLDKGVYLVRARASLQGGPIATDVLQFHIDPPTEGPLGVSMLHVAVAIGILMTVVGLFILRRSIHRRFRRTNRHLIRLL